MASLPSAPTPSSDALQAADIATAQNPIPQTIPRTTPVPPSKPAIPVSIDSDTQRVDGDIYTLQGNVVIVYGDHTLYADKITYDSQPEEITLTGHVKLIGGENDEHIEASHGTYNIVDGTGRFYDVEGSIQVRSVAPDNSTTATVVGTSYAPQRQPYTNANPFLFRGRMVVKTGRADYVVYDGSVTSCLLPPP